MMNIHETLQYINSFTWSKTRLGLGRTRELLSRLDNPQKKLSFVHVAGSNGKGSTCAMIESVLRCSGYITGLYLSPYIEDFKESFQCAGEYITDEELSEITEQVKFVADAMEDHPSQFELKTAIGLLFFAKRRCDIIVLETGMGGEFDSTNVIDAPEVAVLTNIGYDHTEYLGNTLTEIASTKAGIIKQGCDVVSYDNVPEVMAVIEKTAAEKGCTLYRTSGNDAVSLKHSLDGQSFLWRDMSLSMTLLGEHQIKNAFVALKTLEALAKRGYNIPDRAIEEGFKNVRCKARFEVLNKEPLFILDGGHNGQCAEQLAANLELYIPNTKVVFILGVLGDKDYKYMTRILSPFARSYICVTPDNPRALKGEELEKHLKGQGFEAEYVSDIRGAIERAFEKRGPIVAFGSLYMAGEIRRQWKEIKKEETCTI